MPQTDAYAVPGRRMKSKPLTSSPPSRRPRPGRTARDGSAAARGGRWRADDQPLRGRRHWIATDSDEFVGRRRPAAAAARGCRARCRGRTRGRPRGRSTARRSGREASVAARAERSPRARAVGMPRRWNRRCRPPRRRTRRARPGRRDGPISSTAPEPKSPRRAGSAKFPACTTGKVALAAAWRRDGRPARPRRAAR